MNNSLDFDQWIMMANFDVESFDQKALKSMFYDQKQYAKKRGYDFREYATRRFYQRSSNLNFLANQGKRFGELATRWPKANRYEIKKSEIMGRLLKCLLAMNEPSKEERENQYRIDKQARAEARAEARRLRLESEARDKQARAEARYDKYINRVLKNSIIDKIKNHEKYKEILQIYYECRDTDMYEIGENKTKNYKTVSLDAPMWDDPNSTLHDFLSFGD